MLSKSLIYVFRTHFRQGLKVRLFVRYNGTRACVFEVLCEGVSTRFGRRTLTKYPEKTRPTSCSVFQNLRLGSINFLQKHSINRSRCNYPHPRQVPRTDAGLLFRFPNRCLGRIYNTVGNVGSVLSKSSFGVHQGRTLP